MLNANTYHCVNVGSAIIDLNYQNGLTATEVVIAWQSRRSSLSQKIVWYMAKVGSHC